MKDEQNQGPRLAQAPSITEQLARATNKPIDQVAEIYAAASEELERTARIKTLINVLATRRARIILDTSGGAR